MEKSTIPFLNKQALTTKNYRVFLLEKKKKNLNYYRERSRYFLSSYSINDIISFEIRMQLSEGSFDILWIYK